MRLPTKDEINVYNSLDKLTACEHFLDKTLEEVEVLFRESSLGYGQDLVWMGPKAFAFYLQAVINYLRSDFSAGDNDVVNCLCSVIEDRLQDKEFLLARDSVNTIVVYVTDNYEKFAVDTNIYGDLLGKYRQLRNRLKD